VISRRLVIGLLGAGVVAFALYAAPLALALSPEARNARLDETLRGLVEGRAGRVIYPGSPLWDWSTVARWMFMHNKLSREDAVSLRSQGAATEARVPELCESLNCVREA